MISKSYYSYKIGYLKYPIKEKLTDMNVERINRNAK